MNHTPPVETTTI